MSSKELLNDLRSKANQNPVNQKRLEGWDKTLKWSIGREEYFWSTEGKRITNTKVKEPDIILKCSRVTLEEVVAGDLSLFVGLWATDRINFQGSFADAFRLGYVFLEDARKKQIVFLAHCFLNTNTRFPGGSGFKGGTLPLVQKILAMGIGIRQLPCPELNCLGLEKKDYGELVPKELRNCYNQTAEKVISEMKSYQKFGYNIIGVIGMDPSPSCGVYQAKGKGTILGTDSDTSEEKKPGVFIEELRKLICDSELEDVPFIGFRRTLPGEEGIEKKLDELSEELLM